MSARLELWPIAASMWASSAALSPMWRAINSCGFSNSLKGALADISMVGLLANKK
jgi:hypothetical protein